jgi:hypothetical protein
MSNTHSTKAKLNTETLAIDSLTMNDTALARRYKVDRATIYRRKKTAAFKAAFFKVKRAAFGECMARAQGAATAAINTLQEIAEDREQRPAARVSAARAILETAATAFNNENIIERLEALEAAQEEGSE